MGFFIFLAKDRANKVWLIPAGLTLISGKYYGDRKRNQSMRDCEMEEYFLRQRALTNHLKYMEIEISNYDKLNEITKFYDK